MTWKKVLQVSLLILLGCALWAFYVSGDLELFSQNTVKLSPSITKTTMLGESEIIGSDNINCNSGYCDIIVEGKNLKGTDDVLDLAFMSENDLYVSDIQVWVNNPKYDLKYTRACDYREFSPANKTLQLIEENCTETPYYRSHDKYEWLNLNEYVKQVYDDNFGKVVDQYYSPVTFFEDESFKVKYTVKNVIGKGTKYSVGIGGNIWDPLINSSNLYSSNNSFTSDDNSTVSDVVVADTLIEMNYTVSAGARGCSIEDCEANALGNVYACHSGGNITGWREYINVNDMTSSSGRLELVAEGYWAYDLPGGNTNGTDNILSVQVDMIPDVANNPIYWNVADTDTDGEQALHARAGSSTGNVWTIFDGGSTPDGGGWVDDAVNTTIWELDFLNQSTDLWIDGHLVIDDARFRDVHTPTIDRVYWASIVGTNYLDNLTVYGGTTCTAGSTVYNASKKLFSSLVFQPAVNISNWTLNVVEGTFGGVFNNTYNISCDGENYTSITSADLSSGVYSGTCANEGDKLHYFVELNGNTSVSSNVSLLNISFSAVVTSASDQFVVGNEAYNNTVVETSYQSFTQNFTYNRSYVSDLNVTFWFNGVNYSTNEITNVNNGTIDFNISVINVSVNMPLITTNTTSISHFWEWFVIYTNSSSESDNTSNASQTTSYAYWITDLTINNSVKETSSQDYNFSITNLEHLASITALLDINSNNETVSNSSNNYGFNRIVPLITVNTTNHSIIPYINLSYNGISDVRTFIGQDQEISYAYFIDSFTMTGEIYEMSNNSYNFSIREDESRAVTTGILQFNNTNYTTTNSSINFSLSRMAPLVVINSTNISVKPFINVTYNGTSSIRSFTAMQHNIDWVFYISDFFGNDTIFEGMLSNISMNITNVSDNIGNIIPIIEWNNTNFTTTNLVPKYNQTWNYVRFTDKVNVSEFNITLRSFVNISDGSNNVIRNGTTLVQTIKQMSLDNCSTGTIQLLNYTFWNEKTKSDPIYVDLFGFYINYTASGGSGDVVRTFNSTYANITLFKFCAVSPEISYLVNIDSYFQEEGFDTREYRSQNAIISNVTVALKMFLLDSTNSTEITLSVTDGNDIELEDIYVFVYDHDLVNKTETLLGSEVTDVDGKVVFNLDVSDKYYVFRFYQGGILKLTSEPQKLQDTTYTFRLIDSPTTLFTTYRDLRTTKRLLSFNNLTQVVSFNYNDGNNLTSRVCMQTQLINQSSVSLLDETCSTASSANLTYTVTFDNTYYRAVGYAVSRVDGKQYPFSVIDFKTKFLTALGFEGLFWGGLIIMIFAGIGFLVVKKPSVGMAFALIGMLAGTWLGWFEIGTTALMGIVVAFILIVVYILKD